MIKIDKKELAIACDQVYTVFSVTGKGLVLIKKDGDIKVSIRKEGHPWVVLLDLGNLIVEYTKKEFDNGEETVKYLYELVEGLDFVELV